MRPRSVIVLAFAAACGGGGGGSDGDGRPTDVDAVTMPTALCDAPPLFDVSSPTTVIGDGTPGSCTEAVLRSAAAAGGTIVFACGASPVTIPVTSTILFDREAVLDGGDLVTLSGGGTTRILYLDSDYNTPTPRL